MQVDFSISHINYLPSNDENHFQFYHVRQDSDLYFFSVAWYIIAGVKRAWPVSHHLFGEKERGVKVI